MSKFICKILFFLSLFFGFFITIFQLSFLDGYCISTGLLGTSLYNSLGIASEYLVTRAGRSIVNGNSISADIDGVNMGSIQPDYVDINAKAFGITTPIDASYILQNAQDLDVSHMSPTELTQYLSILSDDPNATNGNTFFKKCAVGGVTLYWAVNQYGEWVGSTLNNIMASFDTDTSTLTTSIDDVMSQTYSDDATSFRFGSSFVFSNTVNGRPVRQNCHFGSPIMLWTQNKIIYAFTPVGSSISGGGVINLNNNNYNISSYFIDSSTLQTVVIGGITYYYGKLLAQASYGSTELSSSVNFGTLNDILAYVTDYGFTKTYNAELVDNTNTGYVVPDIGSDIAGIISDIFNVVDNLRDGLIGSIDDGITLNLTDSLTDAIADAIADAISRGLAITDEMHGGGSGGGSSDSDWSVPDWLIPPFLSDLFPDGLFEMFRPIFYIVPDAYSSYSLWILIPTIILFVVFIYFVVSVL